MSDGKEEYERQEVAMLISTLNWAANGGLAVEGSEHSNGTGSIASAALWPHKA